MLTKRIIPCLDIMNGRVVKGVNFSDLKDVGNPVQLAVKYEKEGADEISLLDVTASCEKRPILFDIVRVVADSIFIPFSVGGGITSMAEVQKLIALGAEKVSIGSAAVVSPEFIQNAANKFGSQAVMLSLDVKRNHFMKNGWEVFIHGGRTPTGLDALNFAQKVVKMGAGEILLNSIDRDGVQTGFDIALNHMFSTVLPVPVIASGGAGSLSDFYDVLAEGQADAALGASIFHSNIYSVKDIKLYLREKGMEVRLE